MKREFTALFGSLEGTFVYVLRLCEGQLFLAVVEVVSIRAGRGRSNQRLMVPEDIFVIQVEIIIADADGTIFAFAQSIVEGGIQVIVLFQV